MAQIKITQTSNADMNIGVPKTLTAVEWLVEQYANENYGIEIYEQAKQMEKEQQFRFFIAGQLSMEEGGKDFEQYYNETYERKS